MTQNQFYKELAVTDGQFDFHTVQYEGMIGVSTDSIVIGVDNIGLDSRQTSLFRKIKNDGSRRRERKKAI